MHPKRAHTFFSRDLCLIITLLLVMFGGLLWNGFCLLDQKLRLKLIEKDGFFEVMGRSRAFYAGFDNGRFLSGTFQNQLEKASSDYFPLFAIFSYKKLERFIDRINLSVFPETSAPLLPVGGDVIFDKHNDILSRTPVTISERTRNQLTVQADYYNGLLRSSPSIQLVVVPVLSKPDWMVMSGSLNIRTALFRGDRYARAFRELLDPRIGLFWPGENESPESAIALYFKTDHHLNIRGIYSAYRRLVESIFSGSDQYPHFLEPASWFSIPNLEFRGSEARRAGKFDRLHDSLDDGVFNIPDYHVYIDGVSSDNGYNDLNRRNYLSGSYPEGKFVNHYANYFGEDHGLVEFVNGNSAGKNLLVLGDSFDNALLPLISAHFHQSYFVDLRYFAKKMGRHFSINDFVQENHIAVVVFFSQQLVALGLSDGSPD
jgi:hypothetical protein